jgi:putative membrane protein
VKGHHKWLAFLLKNNQWQPPLYNCSLDAHQCPDRPAALAFSIKKEEAMWWDYWPMHPFFFGPLFMIAIFVICVLMMTWMMRGHRRGGGSRALDILNERYARGEINQAEYDERRRVLRS